MCPYSTYCGLAGHTISILVNNTNPSLLRLIKTSQILLQSIMDLPLNDITLFDTQYLEFKIFFMVGVLVLAIGYNI